MVCNCVASDIQHDKEHKKLVDLHSQVVFCFMNNICCICVLEKFFYIQSEILEKVGPDALKLGLLMGTEDDPREEEQQEVLSFHHLLIMEFVAGKYLSTLTEVSKCTYNSFSAG